MVGGTLYTYPDNFRAYKVLIAAQFSGANVVVDPNFVFGETNKTKDFLAKFPTGKVPAFEAHDGTCLTESNAISFYVASQAMRGSDSIHSAQVLQWMQFAESEILPPALNWVLPVLGAMHHNKQHEQRAKDDVRKAMKVLNDHLLHHTFLVGERISLADVVVACNLMQLYQHVMDQSFRSAFGNTNRWFNTVINQPQVKKVIGNFKLCEKMAIHDPKKAADQAAKHGDRHKKHYHHHGNHPPKKEEKKPAKSEETTKPVEAEVPENDDPKPEKQTDPFAAMPKGNFDMDDFKRFYSNKSEDESVPYFWEKFDKEHYSIWRCDYKYNNELAMVFMSCNLIGGMFQRLEKLRKNAFASMALFGEDNNSSISGIWVWKGHELAFELSEDWKIDYSSYSWKKLDPDAEDTKKQVEEYFKWQGSDESGRKFNQGKIFK